MKKLHLGCGKRNFPGFINVDLADYPHIHHKRSVDDLSPFENGSVDLIYASHVFEYFKFSDAPRVLAEWRRVLRTGGILKLAVPDLTKLISAYEISHNALDIQGPIYGLMDIISDGKPRVVYHKVLYDFNLLEKILEQNGFDCVMRYDWKEFLPEGTEDHSAAYIPSRDYADGICVSLNIQAAKAGEFKAIRLSAKRAVANIIWRAKRKVQRLNFKP